MIRIPPYVRMGISWRAIKLENGRTPPWVDNMPPASALHIDMDWFHAPVYKPDLAKLFKKHGQMKPLGLTLRLVPCFSADEGKNATTDRRVAAVEMRDKQEYLIKEHITTIKTPYILNLDKPTKPQGTMTLRRYLKNLHPQGLVAARLILSVDRAWQEGSKDTNIVTTKEFAPQVQDAIRNMIPECVHRYGIGTTGWFTTEGLHAFKGVKWDPASNKSVSDKDIEATRVVAEDYFGMGEAWRHKKQTICRPTMMNSNTGNVGDPGKTIHFLDMDYDAIRLAYKSLNLYHQLRIPKWISRRLPVGALVVNWKETNVANCPRCNAPNETHLHIVQCQHPGAREKVTQWIDKLEMWLVRQNTHPDIRLGVTSMMRACTRGLLWSPPSTSDDNVRHAFRQQQRIGPDHVMFGWWASGWAEAQHAYLLSISKRTTGKRWLSRLIKKQWEIAWDLWRHRMEVSSTPDSFSLSRAHEQINASIRALYAQNVGSEHPPLQRWFQQPLHILLQQPLSFKEDWTSMVHSFQED